MIKFIYRITFFLSSVIVFLSAIIFYGNLGSDNFAKKILSGKKKSLIIGCSRSAQGIHPTVLNSYLNRDDIYNYSFTIKHSPYGKLYLSSIKNKIDTTINSNIYIVSVSPWTLSEKINSDSYREEQHTLLSIRYENSLLGRLRYFFNEYNIEPYRMIYNPSPTTLHYNGFLEVDIPIDSLSYNKRLANKIRSYNIKLNSYRPSYSRLNYLSETIKYLSNFGEVYLTRLPVDEYIKAIEDKFYKDFDKKIDSIASVCDIKYFNLINSNKDYKFTDGNHLHYDSGKELTLSLAKLIQRDLDD